MSLSFLFFLCFFFLKGMSLSDYLRWSDGTDRFCHEIGNINTVGSPPEFLKDKFEISHFEMEAATPEPFTYIYLSLIPFIRKKIYWQKFKH